KKDTGPAARHIDEVVLLLGVADVAASKGSTSIAGWRSRGALGVSTSSSPRHQAPSSWRSTGAERSPRTPDGSGSHRLMIRSDAGPFTDPDGLVWEAASRLLVVDQPSNELTLPVV